MQKEKGKLEYISDINKNTEMEINCEKKTNKKGNTKKKGKMAKNKTTVFKLTNFQFRYKQ